MPSEIAPPQVGVWGGRAKPRKLSPAIAWRLNPMFKHREDQHLRSEAGPHMLAHDPHRFGAERDAGTNESRR